MQTNARFVEHIQNTCEAGTNLRRKPNALRFSAGKRSAFAVERQISETDFYEKLEARHDLAHHFPRDRSLLVC